MVTGGRAGIGLAIVNLFLSHGARVASVDVTEAHSAHSVANLLSIRCDVSSDADVVKAVDVVIEKWSRVDVLVNCAGVMDVFAPLGTLTDKQWRRCFAVNVDGPMHFSRAVIPIFLRQESKGSIVNVGSTASIRGSAAGVAYTASKHALLGMSRSTAWIYAKEGIRCNAVLPGGVGGTDIIKNVGGMEALDPDGQAKMGPYGSCCPGFLEPGEIAAAVLFLATASSVNGAELAVDKGWATA